MTLSKAEVLLLREEEALAQPNPDPFDMGFNCVLAGVGLEGHEG